MFKLDPSPSYTWPVTVPQLTEDGKANTAEFTARFKRLPQSEIDGILKRTQAGELSDEALAEMILVGWDGVQDANGQPLPVSPETRKTLLDVVPVRPAVIRAWFESVSGAPRKN
jgi:hypothetical protein